MSIYVSYIYIYIYIVYNSSYAYIGLIDSNSPFRAPRSLQATDTPQCRGSSMDPRSGAPGASCWAPKGEDKWFVY